MRILATGLVALLIGVGALAPAASAQTTCNAYFTASQGMSDAVGKAYNAMSAKNLETQKTLLPSLEALLRPLLAQEIKPEACNGTHINAYTSYQYAQLNFQRSRGVDIGFPANLPIVKQPDLNHTALAYSVGWIKYELGDFSGALAAYEKGLAMFPHDPNLQNEYLATLMQLKRHKDVIAFSDKVLGDAYDLSDANRAKIYLARGISQFANGDMAGAEDSVTTSTRYDSGNDDAYATLDQIKEARKPKAN